MSADVDDMISGPPAQRQTAGAAFQASPTIGKLAGALAKAQGAFEPIGKTREVTVTPKKEGARPYKFSYAPLDTVLAAVRPALAANGLAIMQTIADRHEDSEDRTMTTTLLHESGEFIASTTTLPGQASTAQEFGSQVTYMRRYAIVSILGVVAEEDDDGNAAAGNDFDSRDRQPPPRRGEPPRGQPAERERQPTELERKQANLSRLLTAPAPDGCGWAVAKCTNWSKKYFGGAERPSDMNEQQVQDATLLALAFMEGGDTGYKAKLAELQAAGRVAGEKGKAA